MKVLAVQEDSIMPYKDTMKLRFLLVALVFVFHASLVFGFVFPDVGHTAVAVFFFMSGFGLETSLMSKKGYMASFLQKRVFGLMIQYWILMVFIAAAAAVFSLSMSGFVESIQTAFFTYPIGT